MCLSHLEIETSRTAKAESLGPLAAAEGLGSLCSKASELAKTKPQWSTRYSEESAGVGTGSSTSQTELWSREICCFVRDLEFVEECVPLSHRHPLLLGDLEYIKHKYTTLKMRVSEISFLDHTKGLSAG